ncbi:MAG: NAD(+) diphosphatase [Gammaproteobacteria bacterium]|nr:NAD(+) diphosphatase [Gammaproteobacteria bacterium]
MDWEFLDIANEFNSGISPSIQSDASYHIIISDDEILSINGVHPWRPLNQDEWRWSGLDATVEHYLGEAMGIPIFACEVDPEADNPPGYEFETLWTFLGQVDEPIFYLIGRAKQIVEWHRDHQFCGQCGAPTTASEKDRSRVCKACSQTFYPRLSPSIIALVTKGEELLLAKNTRARGNFYSTLAGFIEPGESIEEAVHREVYEEVGIRIKNLRYYSSQSWPFPNSLMLGFHAEYDSGEFVLQKDEIVDAQWFYYQNLPNRPAMFSISGWLIDDYIKRLQNQQ